MPRVSVTSYREADALLRRPDLRQSLYDEGAVLMSRVLVNLHGEEHRIRRTVEARIFRRDVFRYYEEQVFPQTVEETLAPFIATGRCDLVDFGYRVMLNLTADFSGIDRPEKSAAETATLLRLLRTFARAATLGQTLTEDREPIRAEIRAALAEFDADFFTPSMERRRALVDAHREGRLAEEDLPRDVLTVLLQDEAKLPDASHDTLMKELAFYLLAGAFTSIHSLTDAMHEIFEWSAAHLDDAARLDRDPLFVQRCAYESMRLHPSSPVACRRPTAPVGLGGLGALGPEDEIVIDLLSANKDEGVFGADAADYNPHRPVERGPGPYGLSFGMGAHACIGRNLAAGVQPRADTDPGDHHYGTIALLILALRRAGARPDPDDPAERDLSTTRRKWAKYPVLLGSPAS